MKVYVKDGVNYSINPPPVVTPIEVDLSPTGEIRSVSSTGGEKGVKDADFSLLPWMAIWSLAEHFGRGARKYSARNWEKGYEWSKNFSALMRHLAAWWEGEDIDEETGSHHLDAVMWHAVVLRQFTQSEKYAEFDDRPER